MIVYDVCDFMQQCVQAYKNACGEPDMQLRKVDTPFLPSHEGGDMRRRLYKKANLPERCNQLLALF